MEPFWRAGLAGMILVAAGISLVTAPDRSISPPQIPEFTLTVREYLIERDGTRYLTGQSEIARRRDAVFASVHRSESGQLLHQSIARRPASLEIGPGCRSSSDDLYTEYADGGVVARYRTVKVTQFNGHIMEWRTPSLDCAVLQHYSDSRNGCARVWQTVKVVESPPAASLFTPDPALRPSARNALEGTSKKFVLSLLDRR